MRLLFVNHCHPDTPHVCATRVREMAKACAREGHQVILLTETLPGGRSTIAPEHLAAALDSHDWALPFGLACAPARAPLLNALRQGRIAAPLRKPGLAVAYLARGGVFTDWRDGSAPYWPALARHFRPDAVWATFGNTDAWAIGQAVARLSGCPWVMDIKDPWSVFIPAMLRRALAVRFGDAAAATALSAQHGEDLARWFPHKAVTIYSGIHCGAPSAELGATRRLLVVGALYAPHHLAELVEGIRQWNRPGVTLTYAGAEAERFRAAVSGLDCVVETPGYVTLDRLAALAADSLAILYVRNPAALYQHKLVEALAFGRPVLCLPEEAPEAEAIAARLGAAFRSCADAAALAGGLEAVAGHAGRLDSAALSRFTWDAQAQRLASVLEGAK